MLWRSNKRKNSADPRPEGGVSPAQSGVPARQAGGDTYEAAEMKTAAAGQDHMKAQLRRWRAMRQVADRPEVKRTGKPC